MARYRKIDTRIWNDAKFRSLSDDGKLCFLFVLTHPSMTMLGAMRASVPGLASELGLSQEAFAEAFRQTLSMELLRHDEDACFVWAPNFLKYNAPESPNVVKSWAGALDLLPECELKFTLIQHVARFVRGLSKGFREALPEAFAKTLPNQEQEQEPEQEPEQEVLSHTREASSTSGKAADDDRTSGKPAELPPPDAFNHEAELQFVQEWNALADELPAYLVRHGSSELTKFQRDRLADRWAATWSSDWPEFVAYLRSGRCGKTAMTIKQVVEGDLLDRVVAEAKHPQTQHRPASRRSSRRSSGSGNTSADRWQDFDAVDLERRLSKYKQQIQSIEANTSATTDDLQRLTELQATANEIDAEIGRRKDKARERLDRARLFDDDIVVDDLTDVRRRDRLFNRLVDGGHLQHTDTNRLRLHTLAVHVAESASAKNPPALFLSLLKAALAGDGWPGSDAQEDHTREQLRGLVAKKSPGRQLSALGDKLYAVVPAGGGANV